MSDELTKRLREWAKDAQLGYSLAGADQDLKEAADTIETLRKERDDALAQTNPSESA